MKIALGLLMAVSMVVSIAGGQNGERHSRSTRRYREDRGGRRLSESVQLPLHRAGCAGRWTWRCCRGSRRAEARAAGPIDVVCRTGEGVRQPVLPRPDRVLRVGRHDVGRHHRDRHDLRLFRRRRSGRRAEEAGSRPGHDQIRRRHASPSRSPRRREVPSGSIRHARHHVGGGLGFPRSNQRHEAEA